MRSTFTRPAVLAALTAGIVLPFALVGSAAASTGQATTCNANPTRADFIATYAPGSVTNVTISYVGQKPMCAGVNQAVSFNAYLTQGPTWPTSGKQTLVDHQTTTLSAAKTSAKLAVKLTNGCFYQTDAYLGSTRFDGVDGTLPKYPNAVFPTGLLAASNGGSKVCGVPTPTPTPTVTPTPTPTPTVTPTPVVTPTPTTTPGKGGGEVLSTSTTLPTVGGSDLAVALSGLGGAIGFVLKRRAAK